MIATLTNTSGATMNALDTLSIGAAGPAQLTATGGARKSPLPYPFNRNGSVANSGTLVLPVHHADLLHKEVPSLPHTPRTELNGLIQSGQITVAWAAQTPIRDVEEKFLNSV